MCTNYFPQLKYELNQVYLNTKHTTNYMHTEYLMPLQITAYLLDEIILAIFCGYCKLAQNWSQYLKLAITYEKLLPALLALHKLRPA